MQPNLLILDLAGLGKPSMLWMLAMLARLFSLKNIYVRFFFLEIPEILLNCSLGDLFEYMGPLWIYFFVQGPPFLYLSTKTFPSR